MVSHAWYFKFVEFPEILQALATPLIANKLSKVTKLYSVDGQIMTNIFYTRNNWRAEAGDKAPMIANKDVSLVSNRDSLHLSQNAQSCGISWLVECGW